MKRPALIVGITVLAVLAAGGAGYWTYRTLRTREAPREPATPVTTEEDRAEDARTIIADLKRSEPVDYAGAFARAEQFQKDGRLADAQLLYFFAARGGNAASAFALATMNDPNHHSATSSLLPEPDAFQAFKWYTAARDAGMAAADQRLAALHDWAENAAADGNVDAERLLLQWESTPR